MSPPIEEAESPAPVPHRVGPYRILDPLASGRQGRIYRAIHEPLKRFVCLKLLSSMPDDDDAVRRFIREMRIAATLSHPNVVKVFDGGCTENPPYLVMELLDGITLDIAVKTPRPLLETLSIAIGLADGLAYLHQHRILHRDIKPTNIFLTAGGVPKLLDFGLCLPAASLGLEAITATGSVVGTPLFLAPELLDGVLVAPVSDMWALGCVFYLLFSGRMPFPVTSVPGWVTSLLSDPIPSLSELEPAIPHELSELVSTLVIRDPKLRLASAAFLRDRLQELAHLRGLHAVTPSQLRPAALPPAAGGDGISKTVVEARPPSGRRRLRRGWVVPLTVLCTLAALVAWRFHGGHPLATVAATPVARGREDSATVFGRWRRVVPYINQLQDYSRTGKQARLPPGRAAQLERLVSLKLGEDPGLWLHWVHVGRWLDAMPRSPTPVRYPAAQTGVMDSVVERLIASPLSEIVKKARQESAQKGYQLEIFRIFAPEYLVYALRTSQNYPDDPLGWLFLGRALDVEGLTGHAATVYQLALARSPRRTFTTTTPRWAWWALVRALLLAPGHSLEAEWLHEEAIRTEGHDPEWPWEAITLSEGVPPSARERILIAASKRPRTAEFASLWLGRVLDWKGSRAAALRTWEEGLAVAPRSWVLATQLIGGLLRSGQVEAALTQYARYRPEDANYEFGRPVGLPEPFTNGAIANAELISNISAELSETFGELTRYQIAPSDAERQAAIKEAGLHQ
jgi:tetratricopeptide (TPR) repeat protein